MNRSGALFIAVTLLLSDGQLLFAAQATPAASTKADSGDTAWMLVSTGLVLLMVPGLALFYGGMVRRKNILGTMMHSMVALAIIGIQWLLIGYCLAFGKSQGGIIGWDPAYLGLEGVLSNATFPGTKIPIFVHCMYQGMFAIITPALISGALAERIRFGPYCLFIALWTTLVYCPLAHWTWAVDAQGESAGWLGGLGALDFAGGTVVHIAAGFSGLAAILVLRKRFGYPQQAMHPNSIVLTLLGAGLLWFGWFGFNGGSAMGSGGLAGAAVAASQVAAAGAALSWILVEWRHRGKPTALGLASGLVAGLVAVTPASGYVTPLAALFIGLVAGALCYGSVCLKPFFKYDDSLDAFGIHGVGGLLGAVLTGVFASVVLWQAGADSTAPLGKLANGRLAQIGVQLLAAAVAAGFAFGVSLVLVKVIDRVWGFCLDAEQENEGLDRSQHGEVGMDLGPSLELARERPLQRPRRVAIETMIGGSEADLIRSQSAGHAAGFAAPPRPFVPSTPGEATKWIVAIIRPEKLEAVQEALNDCGIHLMTISDVRGYGQQAGYTEYYRGAEFQVHHLAKIKIEIAVKDEDIEPTIEAITRAARTGSTGQLGDGKIFVLPLESSIRIRTGERGLLAVSQ